MPLSPPKLSRHWDRQPKLCTSSCCTKNPIRALNTSTASPKMSHYPPEVTATAGSTGRGVIVVPVVAEVCKKIHCVTLNKFLINEFHLSGVQTRNVSCAKTSDFEMVSDDLCDPQLQPIVNRTCATDACDPRSAIRLNTCFEYYKGNNLHVLF